MCKNTNCKKKLSEYRELTRNRYEDIDGLEQDIRDKDAFAHIDFQKDVVTLKKKYDELSRDNSDLIKKNEQLDEDTEDGIKMLRSAHDRDRKLKLEIDEYNEALFRDAKKISELEKNSKTLSLDLPH